jgi:hypothetical protein
MPRNLIRVLGLGLAWLAGPARAQDDAVETMRVEVWLR